MKIYFQKEISKIKESILKDLTGNVLILSKFYFLRVI